MGLHLRRVEGQPQNAFDIVAGQVIQYITVYQIPKTWNV